MMNPTTLLGLYLYGGWTGLVEFDQITLCDVSSSLLPVVILFHPIYRPWMAGVDGDGGTEVRLMMVEDGG